MMNEDLMQDGGPGAATAGQFIHFTSAGKHMLLHIEDVSEVVPLMSLTGVDHMGGSCRGMLNLRGEMIPVFDVQAPGEEVNQLSRLILVSRRSSTLGLLVDDVVDVVVVPPSQIAERPLGGGKRATFARLEDAVLPIFEPVAVLA